MRPGPWSVPSRLRQFRGKVGGMRAQYSPLPRRLAVSCPRAAGLTATAPAPPRLRHGSPALLKPAVGEPWPRRPHSPGHRKARPSLHQGGNSWGMGGRKELGLSRADATPRPQRQNVTGGRRALHVASLPFSATTGTTEHRAERPPSPPAPLHGAERPLLPLPSRPKGSGGVMVRQWPSRVCKASTVVGATHQRKRAEEEAEGNKKKETSFPGAGAGRRRGLSSGETQVKASGSRHRKRSPRSLVQRSIFLRH